MRKKIICLLAVLMAGVMALQSTVAAAHSSQDEQVGQLLERVAQYVKRLGAYSADFKVVAGDYSTRGRYDVSGDRYYIVLDQAEVYSDGHVRYEVNGERKEINVDEVDISSHNILDNPTRCFDFVGSDYVADIQRREAGRITIHLRSADSSVGGDIYLTIDSSSARPIRLEYHLYDDVIEVDILSLAALKGSVKTFAERAYSGYDMIDFR